MHGKLAFVRVWDRAARVCMCGPWWTSLFFSPKLVFSPPSRWSNETNWRGSQLPQSSTRGVRVPPWLADGSYFICRRVVAPIACAQQRLWSVTLRLVLAFAFSAFGQGACCFSKSVKCPPFFYIYTYNTKEILYFFRSYVTLLLPKEFHRNYTKVSQEKHMKIFWHSKGDLIGLKAIFYSFLVMDQLRLFSVESIVLQYTKKSTQDEKYGASARYTLHNVKYHTYIF